MNVLPGDLVLSLVECCVVKILIDGEHFRGRNVQLRQADLLIHALIVLNLLQEKNLANSYMYVRVQLFFVVFVLMRICFLRQVKIRSHCFFVA